MAFHGTENRSAENIAKAVDALGGDVSIDAGRDYAAYVAKVEPAKLEDGFDLLADLALLTDAYLGRTVGRVETAARRAAGGGKGRRLQLGGHLPA